MISSDIRINKSDCDASFQVWNLIQSPRRRSVRLSTSVAQVLRRCNGSSMESGKVPDGRTIRRWHELFLTTGSAVTVKRRRSSSVRKEEIDSRVIEHFEDHSNTSESRLDRLTCDFFLWGFLKSKVYQTRPSTIPELKEKITMAFDEVTSEMCNRLLFHTVNASSLSLTMTGSCGSVLKDF